MKTLFNFSAIVFLFIIGISCSSSDDDFVPPKNTTPTVTNTPVVTTPVVNTPVVNTVNATFKADLKSQTGTTSMGSGTATLQLNNTSNIVTVDIVFSGTEPYAAGIIQTDNGGWVFGYELNPNAYSIEDVIPFTSPVHFDEELNNSQITGLMNNKYFLVLYTIAYPNGEISGTLIKQ